MPLYTYRCISCNELTEITHHMQERPVVVCQFCDGPTHKIIVDFPHVAFDYNAWYTNDVNPKMVLHPAKSGKSSPLSQDAGGRL